MNLNITCPTDPEHNSFETTATVLESWEVDREGNWQTTLSALETVHGPDPDNIFTCLICDTVAVVAR